MTNELTRRAELKSWFLEQIHLICARHEIHDDFEAAHLLADELLLQALEKLGCSEMSDRWRSMASKLRFQYS